MMATDLFADNLDWAHHVADAIHRRVPPNVDRDDLRQEAAVALWKVSRRFRPELGYAFRTFAEPAVRGGVLDYLRRTDHLKWRHRAQLGADAIRLGPLPRSLTAKPDDHAAEVADLFAALCRRLRPEVRLVLLLRAQNLTGPEVATRLGLHASRVSQLFAEAVRRGRRELPGEVLSEPVPLRDLEIGRDWRRYP